MDTNGHIYLCEDYVSFETAKLLKEKGFDSNMYTCYTDCEFPEFLTMIDYVVQGEEYERSNFESHNLIQAPTHQMALKWLREVHNIHITILQIESTTITMEQKYFFYRIQKNRRTVGIFEDTFLKYEQAVEAACLWVLKNLL